MNKTLKLNKLQRKSMAEVIIMDKVVITGMGVVSSAGCNLEEFWNNLMAGKVTYGDIKEFKNNNNYRIKIGAKIYDNSWEESIRKDLAMEYGKASKYAIYSALSALKHSKLSPADLPFGRTAISIGTTMGEIDVEEQISEIKGAKGINSIPKRLLSQYKTDNIALAVGKAIDASGPIYNVPAACAAGNYAIAIGKRLIEWGHADIVIAGGVDVFSRVAFTGFQRLLSLAPDMCRPFDRSRRGLVVGEGCGIVILEKESMAKARGARILGELLGVGLTSDRYHMTASHPDGDGAIRAMKMALDEAGISSDDIDYVSAHGTGTPVNDRIETKALDKIFGNEKIPPTSSIKSMIGHAMGAASTLELIASLQMMEYGYMLPTVNHSELDPQCQIDCVPNKARRGNINYVLSNSFGFGGQISSAIIKRR